MEVNTRDIGAFIKPLIAIQNWTGVAAGSGDNTEKVGEIIDLLALSPDFSSAQILVGGTATIADTKTLTLKSFILYHGSASNMSDEAVFATIIAAAGQIIKTASGSFTGVVGFFGNVDISGCKRYIRVKVTPDLNASGTDTFNLTGVMILGGADRVPVTAGIV
jgi:hypothetical protein